MERDETSAKIGHARLRLMLNALLEKLSLSLIAGLAAALSILLVERTFYLNLPVIKVALWVLGAAVAVAVILALLSIPRALAVAVILDKRSKSKERLSSLLLMPFPQSPMEEEFHREANGFLESLNVARCIPLTPPPKIVHLSAAILLYALAYLLFPQLDVVGTRAREEERATKKKEVAKLATIPLQQSVRELKKEAEKKGMKQVPALVKKIEDVSNTMEKDAPEKKEALAKISSLTEEAKEMANDLAENKSRLKESFETLKKWEKERNDETSRLWKDLAEGKLSEAIKDIEDLRKEITEGKLPREELDQLKKEMEQIADQLDQLGEKKLEELQRSLQSMAQAIENRDLQKLLDDMKELQGDLADLQEGLQELDLTELALQDLLELKEGLIHELNGCPDGAG